MKRNYKELFKFILFLTSLYAVTVSVFYLTATQAYRSIQCFDTLRKVMFVLLVPLLTKYVFQLACAPLYSVVERWGKKSRLAQPTPSVSVLIPAWNEEVGIIKTIQSILNTKYSNLQIVVINDGSTDMTHEKVTQFMADNHGEYPAGITIKYLNLSNGGKAQAMNRALVHATGEFIITIDADSVMDPEAITNFVEHFSSPSIGAVAGNVIVGNRKKPIEWMQQLEYLHGFFFKRADSLFNSVYIIGGAAAAYRKTVLQEVGDFDHNIITEDIEMSTRILKYGYKTRYAFNAVIYTEGPSEFKCLCNQRLRWKYGRILTFIKHRKLFFSFQAKHNPYLTFMLLPLAVYAELLLLAEALLLSIFFIYTVYTSDYLPLASVIALLSTIVGIQILFDPKRRFHRNLVLLAPVAWLIFFVMDMIEFQALIRSLRLLVTKKDLKWQKWVRVGILNKTCIENAAFD